MPVQLDGFQLFFLLRDSEMAASEGERSISTILRKKKKKKEREQSINATIGCNWLLITLTKGGCNKAVISLGSIGSAGFAGSAVYSLQFRRFSTRYFGICHFSCSIEVLGILQWSPPPLLGRNWNLEIRKSWHRKTSDVQVGSRMNL